MLYYEYSACTPTWQCSRPSRSWRRARSVACTQRTPRPLSTASPVPASCTAAAGSEAIHTTDRQDSQREARNIKMQHITEHKNKTQKRMQFRNNPGQDKRHYPLCWGQRGSGGRGGGGACAAAKARIMAASPMHWRDTGNAPSPCASSVTAGATHD